MKNFCTFFGHRDAPESIRYDLKQVLIDLIENEGVEWFLVGNNGKFDSMVLSELKLFSTVYTHINYSVVLHSLSEGNKNEDWEHSLYPDEELEAVPKRYAIDHRNKLMLNEADYVVTYVWKNYGGAYKFKSLAERKGKTVINLCK